MSRIVKLSSIAATVAAVGLSLAACGSEEAAVASSTAPAAASTSAVTVAGPKPAPPPASIPAEKETSVVSGTQCGLTKGPDGALTIVILEGSVTCDTAKKIAADYGPKIATGTEQKVSDWTCGPTQTTGVLAKCVKGSDAFGLVAK